jgi:hypothetical protein
METGDESNLERIAAGKKYDRNRCRCGLRGKRRRGAPQGRDHGDPLANQIGSQ